MGFFQERNMSERDEYIRIPKPPRIVWQGAALFLSSVILGAGITSCVKNAESSQGPSPKPSPTLPSETLNPVESPIVIPTQSQDATAQPTEPISINGEIRPVLDEESNLSLQEYGLNWTPDGHITYFTMPDGSKRYFISANVSTWMIETSGQKSLKDYILAGELNQSSIREVIVPTGNFSDSNDYKNGYVGLASVVQIEKETNPMHLIATAHCEQRINSAGSDSFSATVALFESFDGGLSWEDKGPIIRGRNQQPPGDRISGAGQPAAIIKDGYLYIQYIEWATGADQIYSAKMQILENGTLGPIENIEDESGQLKPVLSIPNGGGYAALPSLSYNEGLGKFLAIIETGEGFAYSTSSDLENWDPEKYVLKYSDYNSAPRWQNLSAGQRFITYPTFLSENKPTDQITGIYGELYFATRAFGDNSHNLTSIDLNFNGS
ncbi:MAG: hypothetical protein A2684_01515 [Candidatus Levybacteria bacterium RIFCSPHIGHO2_01_FULL_36_15b]|nr:MAG: hypothetical protein A2684_01515 [Candidatus Levybacteria bacterium RIFCSPHIGHO2_01_FULL_36_15b]